MGAALPGGQYTESFPQATSRLETLPAGHTNPGLHTPLHTGELRPPAHPNVPAGHVKLAPPRQYCPGGHGMLANWVVKLLTGVAGRVSSPGAATMGVALPSGQYTLTLPQGR